MVAGLDVVPACVSAWVLVSTRQTKLSSRRERSKTNSTLFDMKPGVAASTVGERCEMPAKIFFIHGAGHDKEVVILVLSYRINL